MSAPAKPTRQQVADSETILFNDLPADPPYGSNEKYQAHLLDQYKLYVEMADRVSSRRQSGNSYFLSVNAAIIGFVGYLTAKESNEYLWMLGLGGIALSCFWYQLIRSYKNLNTAKFLVIHDIEKRLPISPYDAEWERMGRGVESRLYKPLSHIELGVPWIFLFLHAIVIWRTFPTAAFLAWLVAFKAALIGAS